MGLFTSVYKDRKCPRCARAYRCDFQIKTGYDFCDVFKDGERVPKNVKKGAYGACRRALCNSCEEFVINTVTWIANKSQALVFSVFPKAEVVVAANERYQNAVRINGRSVAGFSAGGLLMGDGISHHWLSTVRPNGPFKALRKVVEDYWRRMAKCANIQDYVEIKYQKKDILFADPGGKRRPEYQLSIAADGPSLFGALVVVKDRFKVIDELPEEVVEEHIKRLSAGI